MSSNRFHVVVIGAGPVGKTSLVNALLGRSVGETGPTIGTTHHGLGHTYSVEGVEGTLLLTDTPALGDPGSEGTARAEDARLERARQADLVMFVVEHDLTRTERDTLVELSRLGKRLIVVLNKKDRFTEDDRESISIKLRERLEGFVPAEDIVAVAADPAAVSIRVRKPDGTTEVELEVQPPELEALEERVAEIIESEGEACRPATCCCGHGCASRPVKSSSRSCRDRARALIEATSGSRP